jgi:type VI secretion system protein ImpB
MAANQESKQRYLGRNRPPRVQITYDVEIGNAFETTELPLVVGILSDLSGNPEAKPASLDKRGFVDIDRDSFDTVLSRINPQLSFNVDNVLDGQAGTSLPVKLSFQSFEDFSPENIVAQVGGLKDLYDKRQKLQDLLIKLDGNAELITLSEGLADSAALQLFQADLVKALAAPDTAVAATVTAETATVTPVVEVSDQPSVTPEVTPVVPPVDPTKP